MENTSNLPVLNVNIDSLEKKQLVNSEQLINFYNEIISDIRQDREELNSLINDFSNMVINDNDCSTSTKEALVNLIKIRSDTADKKTKIMELLLKHHDNKPKSVSAYQHNEYKIENAARQREFLRQINEDSDK